MPVPHANEPYTGVSEVKSEGGGGSPLSTHYSADDFGGNIAQAGEQLGNAGVEGANHYLGLINETAANNAEASFIKQAGDLKAKYMQYEGLQAEAMRPQYESDLDALRNINRKGLALNAQHMFDSTTTRTLSYQTSEYSGYAANQVKKANIDSQKAIGKTAINSAGDLGSVLDDTRVGEALGTIAHSGNAIADATGLGFQSTGTDPVTGNFNYPDTPEGQKAKAQHLEYTDEMKANYFVTGAKTVADNMGATAAAEWAQKHWDLMPDAAKVKMNQYLAPKVKNEIISGNIANMITQANSDYNKGVLSNVPSSPTSPTVPQNDPLDIIRQNEGEGYSKDSKGEVVNGINSLAFPKEFSEAKKILDTQGQAAATKYADDFYKKNIIDKYDINSLPAASQVIVADGLVNHGAGQFGQSLIQAAKDGATPQQLIDMRRNEYNRLATDNPEQYGKSLKGWNTRLDRLQDLQTKQATYQNKADYLRNHEEGWVQGSVNNYLKQYPDDYYGAQLQERRARTEIKHQIAQEDSVLKSDRDTISNAVNGSMTKGNPPATYEELKALPGMQPILDRAMQQQGEFFHGIDTMIAKASHRDQVNNSANGYDTILRTLEPNDPQEHPNRIESVDHLDKLLGNNRATGINWKDYQDAKKAIEIGDPMKDFLSKNMKQISVANGNVDGKGQQRAIAWYNQVMDEKQKNDAKGEKATPESDFINALNQKEHPLTPQPPSRMQQISNWASSLFKSKQQMPSFNSPQDPEFVKLPSGTQFQITAPNGKTEIRTKK